MFDIFKDDLIDNEYIDIDYNNKELSSYSDNSLKMKLLN